jgi:hypothetical protein
MLYGKTAANAAVAANPNHVGEGSRNPKGKERLEVLPQLTKEFFDSPFFRGFQVQRKSELLPSHSGGTLTWEQDLSSIRTTL